MTCELGKNIILSPNSEPISLQINNKTCEIINDNGNIIVKASGFSNESEGRSFFFYLQSYLAKLSLGNDISLSIPSTIESPYKADHLITNTSFTLNNPDLPEREIKPLIITNIGAWIYPEHEFVYINNLVKVNPQITHTLDSIFEPSRVNRTNPSDKIINENLLNAVICYTYAKNSSMYVWSFLLSVTSLEMLADCSPSSEDTVLAVNDLIQYAKKNYSDNKNIDMNRVNNCIKQATKISITSSVKNIVKKYCAPTIANDPLTYLYSTPEECDQLISAIYNLRSKYVHEGMINKNKKIKHSFHQLHETLLKTLSHILKCVIADNSNAPDENT